MNETREPNVMVRDTHIKYLEKRVQQLSEELKYISVWHPEYCPYCEGVCRVSDDGVTEKTL